MSLDVWMRATLLQHPNQGCIIWETARPLVTEKFLRLAEKLRLEKFDRRRLEFKTDRKKMTWYNNTNFGIPPIVTLYNSLVNDKSSKNSELLQVRKGHFFASLLGEKI